MALTTVPKGNLVTPVGFNPDGGLRPLNFDADGNLLVSTAVPALTDSKARAYLSAVQSIPTATWTKVGLNVESYDTGSDFDIVNHKFVCPVAGWYLVCAGSMIIDIAADKLFYMSAYINGVEGLFGQYHSALVAPIAGAVSDVLYLVADAYIELFVYHTHGFNRNIQYNPHGSFLSVVLLFE